MKATIDIPDGLYRRVKARSAMEGQPVRAIAIRLFEAWMRDAEPQAPQDGAGMDRREDALPSWFGVAGAYASRVSRHDMASVRGSIARGRRRERADGAQGGTSRG